MSSTANSPRDCLALYVNGVRRTVVGGDAFLSLSDYLRQRLGLTGTKIVCSEGDCGACTVLVGRSKAAVGRGSRRAEEPPSGATGPLEQFSAATSDGHGTQTSSPHAARRIDYLAVDSCIQFLFQLDGVHVVTVEGLARHGELTPVQQAMIDCHGSQCGFCTPGFVMAMAGMLEQPGDCGESRLRRGLTGNLCRCTGYEQIIDAGLQACAARRERIDDLYPPDAMLRDMEALRTTPLVVQERRAGQTRTAACPPTLEAALEFLAAHADAAIVAGATDMAVRFNKTHSMPATLLDLNRVEELDYVHLRGDELAVGARTTWAALLEACADRRLAPADARKGAFAELARILSVFGAPQIRHVGTIAGNIANASPIADSLPFLHVMEARLTLARSNSARSNSAYSNSARSTSARSASADRHATRNVNINNFYQGYKRLDLRPGELITEVRIPLPAVDDVVRLYKVSRRRDLDIAGFTAAFRIRRGEDGAIAHAGIALGAVGPTVIRPRAVEQFLVGRPFTEATMAAAGDLAVEEISPISDVRGGADYRRQLARNVLLKFYHQTVEQFAAADGGD